MDVDGFEYSGSLYFKRIPHSITSWESILDTNPNTLQVLGTDLVLVYHESDTIGVCSLYSNNEVISVYVDFEERNMPFSRDVTKFYEEKGIDCYEYKEFTGLPCTYLQINPTVKHVRDVDYDFHILLGLKNQLSK